MEVRALRDADRPSVIATWGEFVARRGQLVDVRRLPGFVAAAGTEVLGTLTYSLVADAGEVVTVDAVRRRSGVGRALMAAVTDAVRLAGCSHLWVVTTNDNTDAVAFYEALGFVLTETRLGAVDEARRTLKPSIPTLGHGGVPIRDELEFRFDL